MDHATHVKVAGNGEEMKTGGLLEQARRGTAGAAKEASSRSQQLWEDAKAKGRQVWGNTRAGGAEVWEDGQALIRKHPGKAIAFAFLAGAALTALSSSRNRNK